jgi:hypothetical protein
MPSNLKELAVAKHTLKVGDVLQGDLYPLVQDGLKVLAMCNYGTTRSVRVAELLNKNQIPAAVIDGGFSILNLLTSQEQLFAINYIQQVPFVVSILTPMEIRDYVSLITRIGKVEFHPNREAVYKSIQDRI